MSDETKAKALAKLDKFTPKIGYPDKWRDYSGLEIKPDDLRRQLAALRRLRPRLQPRQARQARRSRRVVHDARRPSTPTTTRR